MQSAPYQPLLSLAMQLVLAMQQALRCAADVAAAGPAFAIHANTSACNSLLHEGGKAPWGQSSGDLVMLGTLPTMAACNAAAAQWRNASAPAGAQRCLSSCWFHSPWNASFADECYCLSAPTWMPLPSPQADSAVLEWPCEGPADCSYNGECSGAAAGAAAGQCRCSAAWGGVRCGELQLLPVERGAPGLRELDARGGNVSTWGAPVLYDEEGGKWHGWASEMTHGCGINARRLGGSERRTRRTDTSAVQLA